MRKEEKKIAQAKRIAKLKTPKRAWTSIKRASKIVELMIEAKKTQVKKNMKLDVISDKVNRGVQKY